MKKQYYRHVAGANPPDPSLMGDRRVNTQKLRAWIMSLERGSRKQKHGGFVTSLSEMTRVAKVKRSWKNV